MTSQENFHNKRKQSWRQLWLDIHLYLGLIVGAVLVIIGITGSVLVFFQEIDEWLNPQLLTVTVPQQIENADGGLASHQPLQEIIRAAERVATQDSKISTVYGPRDGTGVYAVYVDQDSGSRQHIFVDPYRAQVTGVRSHSVDQWLPDHLMGFVFQLHYSLLLGANGITLVAIIALLLMISLISGLIVWWPMNGQWRKALSIKLNAGAVRFNFDVHKTFSLYFFPILGAVLLSGVYMNLNEPFVWVTQQFSPATRDPQDQLESVFNAEVAPIGVGQAWTITREYFPDGELHVIYLPESATGVYSVVQRDVPKLSAYWSERQIAIDQYSGEILEVRAPDSRRSAGETFLDWQWPLHSGKAFGWIGRILVFLCGLACPVIYITGVIRWLQKRKTPKIKTSKLQSPIASGNKQSGSIV